MAALSLFLIGAPRSGKSAVFDALTNTPEGPKFTNKSGSRVGNVKVPDDRLVQLREMYKPERFVPAEVTFVDVDNPPTPKEGAALSQITAFLADADAFVVVVQAFGEFDGKGQPLNSVAQLDSVLMDLILSDLERVEKRLEKINHERKRGLKVQESEATALEKCKPWLEEGKPLSTLNLSSEDLKAIASLNFLSKKPLLVVANTSEDKLQGEGEDALAVSAKSHGAEMLRFCAPLENEIAQLTPDMQAEFLQGYGLTQPARIRLLQSAYRLLDLISFFTVGEDEVRAWTIRRGTNAQAAAGKIHSDIERGFIRAETVASSDLLQLGNMAACREKALLRLEGKEYEVKDGDVINFRFNA